MDSATLKETPLTDDPVSTRAVAATPVRSVTGYGARTRIGRRILCRSRHHSMRCDMRPKAEIDRLVGHFLDRKYTVGKRLRGGFKCLSRSVKVAYHVAIAHQRKLVTMFTQDFAKHTDEGIIVAIDLELLARLIHCSSPLRHVDGIARFVARANAPAAKRIESQTNGLRAGARP